MKTTIEVDLKPFTVPNVVIQKRLKAVEESDPDGALKLRLGDLDSKTLDRLCREFTTSVFTLAGKSRLDEAAPCPTNINDALIHVTGLSDAVCGLIEALEHRTSSHGCNAAKGALAAWDKARNK